MEYLIIGLIVLAAITAIIISIKFDHLCDNVKEIRRLLEEEDDG